MRGDSPEMCQNTLKIAFSFYTNLLFIDRKLSKKVDFFKIAVFGASAFFSKKNRKMQCADRVIVIFVFVVWGVGKRNTRQ